MNKNGKIKGKFNIIDLLVIVLVLAVIGGIVLRYGSRITTAVKSSEDFKYVVRVEGVKQFTIDALEKSKNEAVTDKKSEMYLGTIVDVAVEPAKQTDAQTSEGDIVEAPLPERYTAYVTIETQGKESDNSYITADSNELSVGRTTELYTKYVHTSGMIESVTKVNE